MPPISTTSTDRFPKILFWVGILIIPTILIIQVLIYQPFFGHMDDGFRLTLIDGQSFIEVLRSYALLHGTSFGYWGATATGMLATLPGYWVGLFAGGPALFAVNVIVLAGCTLVFALGVVRALRLPRISLLPLMVGAFLWPFTYEMVFFPSLQEKGLLLAVGLLFWWVAAGEQVKSNWVFWGLSILIFALSATTKTQIVVFLPAVALTAIASSSRFRSHVRQWGIVFSAAAIGLFVFFAGLTGSYSGAQRSGDIASNFLATYAMLILGIVVAYGVYVGVRFLRGNRNYLELVPLVMMAIFWVSIVYFGYRNYFLSIFWGDVWECGGGGSGKPQVSEVAAIGDGGANRGDCRLDALPNPASF
jgi:hypothetical protein